MKNLILYNTEMKIDSLLSSFSGELKDGIFNDTLHYVEVEEDVFKYLMSKNDNIIHFLGDPNKPGIITKYDFKFTLAPPAPPRMPTQTELLGRMLMEMKISNYKMQKQIEFLGKIIIEAKLGGK